MALGLGVGGAAAAGLQSGFEMGRQADQDTERKTQTARNNARQDQFDIEHRDQLARQNALQDKQAAEHDEDRQFQGANTAIDDARYQLGALHAKYPDGNIPDSEAKPLYTAVGEAHSVRQKLIQKRYQPVVDATQQKWRDFASKAQVGQADPGSLRGQDLRDFIKATTGHDLSEFANGNISNGVNDATTGMQTQNQGMTIKGAGALLGPQVRQGIGGIAPDGSQITNKSLYALVPAPRQPQPQQTPVQGLMAALNAAGGDLSGAPDSPVPATTGEGAPDPAAAASPNQAAVPDSDPSKVIPVLEVTTRQPDGRMTTYHAPVTKDRSTDPSAELAGPLDSQALMDRMGRLGVVDNWLKTPEMAAAVQDALKSGAPTSFEQAWGMVHGDPKAFEAKDATSTKIAAIKKLASDQGVSFDDAARMLDGRGKSATMGPLEKKLEAIADDPDSTPEEKAHARRVAMGIEKVDAKRGLVGLGAKGTGGGGAGGKSGGPSSAALGGAAAPDPKTAPDQTVNFWAQAVIAGDKDWQVGLSRSKSGSALIEAVKRRVPALAGEMGLQPQDIGTARAQSAALGATLKDLTKRSAAVDLFSSKVEKDMITMDNLLDKASTGSPLLLSKPINQLRRQFSDESLAQLDLAAKQVGVEYERLITGGSLSVAQLHAGAAEDAKKLINGDMPPGQARAIMRTMRTEIANARAAAHESTVRIQDQLRGLGKGPLGSAATPGTAVAPTAPGAPSPPPVGTVLKGHRYKGGNPADPASWVKVTP